VRVRSLTRDSESPWARLAMCRFYMDVEEVGSVGAGRILCCPKVYEDSRTWTADSERYPYPVELETIDTKVARLTVATSFSYKKAFFITYQFQS
jgi:hypothetical protein